MLVDGRVASHLNVGLLELSIIAHLARVDEVPPVRTDESNEDEVNIFNPRFWKLVIAPVT